jgi:pseudouridine synthase
MSQRLSKIIARAGLASRRAAEQAMAAGRVTVDGETIRTMGARVDAERQEIRMDGRRVRPGGPRLYLVLHKPRGFITTRSDPGRRRTVMELLPPALSSLFPVGRLDRDTSGLLLLTNDGAFAEKVAHPRYGVPRTYLARVRGVVGERALGKLRRGVTIQGQRMRVSAVSRLVARASTEVARCETRLRLTLREGRNREVRRLLEALGHPVIDLHRERIGPVVDRELALGAFRKLTARELERLLAPQPPRGQAGSRGRHS